MKLRFFKTSPVDTRVGCYQVPAGSKVLGSPDNQHAGVLRLPKGTLLSAAQVYQRWEELGFTYCRND